MLTTLLLAHPDLKTLRHLCIMFSTCSELEDFMYWNCNSMNNLFSYCGLVNGKIRAADKDLPVQYQKILIRKVNGSGNNFVKWVITTIKIRHLKKCFLTFWKNGMKLESVQIIWKILTDVYAGYIFISTAKSLIQVKFKNTFLWNHQKMVYVLTVMRLVLFLVSILIKKI